MDVQEIVALNDLRKALLSVNGAIGRLGRDKDEMVVVLPTMIGCISTMYYLAVLVVLVISILALVIMNLH